MVRNNLRPREQQVPGYQPQMKPIECIFPKILMPKINYNKKLTEISLVIQNKIW